MGIKTGPLGLSSFVLHTLQQVFEQYPEIQQVKIFGSRAEGRQHPGSDIDLAIFAPDMDENTFARLWADIDEQPIAYKMDVLHADRLNNDALLQTIVNHGVQIYPENPLSMETI